MKRILICATLLSTVKALLVPHIRLLQDTGYIVDVAGNGDPEVFANIADKVYDVPFQRNPFSGLNRVAGHQLSILVRNNGYNVIHFHTPVASAFGRWFLRHTKDNGTKILYTAHGFHFFKGAPLKNWLLYYPVERHLAKHTDVLITINNEDYTRARKHFRGTKVEYVPGVGVDIERFRETKIDRLVKREELGISDESFVVVSVGELNRNKNHETVIRAISKLGNRKIHYIICGVGELDQYLGNLVKKLGLQQRVTLLGYRTDIAEIYKASDVFVFLSRREGLGLAAIEAMACGLPIITSNIHGILDYSKDGLTGFTCPPFDVDRVCKSIDMIVSDSALRDRMGKENIERSRKFNIVNSHSKIMEIYGGVLGDNW